MNFLKRIFGGDREEFQEAKVLMEEKSPCCPITAIVEQDDRVAYFYLWGPEKSSFGVKSCWVRNLKPACDEVDSTSMQKGIAPMLAKDHCVYPSGQQELKKENLKIVWLEEGDGAALMENGEVISIIPSWGGMGGFYGYARDCKGEGEFAWELNNSNAMHKRINDSAIFWNSWSNEINPFKIQQPRIIESYVELFGESERYFAIDGDQGMPVGLFLKQGENKTVFSTVGLSLTPMPQIEMHVENRNDFNRIELGLMLNSVALEQEIQSIAQWISGTSSIPWKDITFLSEGHTVHFDAFNNKRFKSVLLTTNLSNLPKVDLKTYQKYPVNFLWMIPISDNERRFAMENGSRELVNKLKEIGNNIFSLERADVIEPK